MPFDAASSRAIAHIAAYVCTDEGAAVARSVLENSVGHMDDLHGGGLSGAARVCYDASAAKIVIAEVGNISVDLACECVAEICQSGADIIVVGELTDITTYRALLKAGALEYFSFPVTAEEILAVERTTPKTETVAETPPRSTSVAVVGTNGGVGTSLLAQNLAFHVAGKKGPNLRTALIDADLQFGSQAIDLDREETIGMFEALMSPERIDATFIAATMDHLSDHLSLYSRQIRFGQDIQTYSAGLPQLYPPLRAEFDTIITDLPRTRLLQNPELAAQFEALVLVIPTGFSGVNAARRLIEGIADHAPDTRIIPVLSDLRPDAKLSRKDITTTIGRGIVATLPRCDAPLTRAHRAARPLIEMQPNGAYAKALRTIWNAVKTDASKPKARSFLKRMLP
jgi:pilus assembly protein CpaE